jgi:hypothetical protein
MIKENFFGSKEVNVPADNISSWCKSSGGTIFAWESYIEQSNVTDIPSRNMKNSNFQTAGQNLELS